MTRTNNPQQQFPQPLVPPAWLIPTGEIYKLNGLTHAEVVKRFLVGLFEVDEPLAKYCKRVFKRFLTYENYQSMNLDDAVEDYAVHALRWVKIGNAYNYNDGKTITIADYDGHKDTIFHYQEIGYFVNVVHLGPHCYAAIEDKEYDGLNIAEVIKKGEKRVKDFEEIMMS